ncbi:general L-amino acid transport system permease protein [Evansella caseinilytica]|uniref:General L-amino acid transport system permease protein n=1 Tax=Evansella caseinilytica TaxID=1503961 RepID=A0A1H3T195_9BACI|nr:ABC transporter permease subunit [Evansella caseinilytica]SDZ43109.1 general L-amino acid transport system permease protein [Evansella caseinilytica]
MNNTAPFWRSRRFKPVLLQLLFVVIAGICLFYFINNALTGLKRLGLPLDFGFLQSTASFDISGDKLIDYSATDPYSRAILVGLFNTLRVAVLGIMFATILGVILGIARLSNNWLVRNTSKVFVEIFRNTPLLVQMIIWFSAVFLMLPLIENSYVFAGTVFFSNRGIAIPWFQTTSATWIWLVCVATAILLAITVWKWRLKLQTETGKRKYPSLWAVGVTAAAMIVPLLLTSAGPFHVTMPEVNPNGRSFAGGFVISPSFASVLIALVMYTSAFIAEIVRAGIMGVSKGQLEAAQALGLKSSTTLRLVVFPQAFRIIIPPLTSQYLNLTKNSSLAVAVGYPEIVHVGNTILNQSGRAIQMITIMIICYLTVSLLTSLFMNIFNKYTQLAER